MPTILSHPAVPLALAVAAGTHIVPPRLLFAGVVASVLPDADVAWFRLGIDDHHHLGHRGFTHSLGFALALGAAAAWCARALRARRWVAFAFVAAAAASHGLLDMCTNGGAGIALFWPLSIERYFFPWLVIEVSPLGIRPFFSERGLTVLLSEMRWVWLPCAIFALIGWQVRARFHKPNIYR